MGCLCVVKSRTGQHCLWGRVADLLTIAETAERLRVSARTVEREIAATRKITRCSRIGYERTQICYASITCPRNVTSPSSIFSTSSGGSSFPRWNVSTANPDAQFVGLASK